LHLLFINFWFGDSSLQTARYDSFVAIPLRAKNIMVVPFLSTLLQQMGQTKMIIVAVISATFEEIPFGHVDVLMHSTDSHQNREIAGQIF
jgi:hypothetical protein